MDWMFKNSDGKPDAMLTIAIIAFSIVTFNLLAATFGSLTIFGMTFSFSQMSAGTMTAYLTPTLGAYCTRRWTTSAYSEGKVAELRQEDIE